MHGEAHVIPQDLRGVAGAGEAGHGRLRHHGRDRRVPGAHAALRLRRRGHQIHRHGAQSRPCEPVLHRGPGRDRERHGAAEPGHRAVRRGDGGRGEGGEGRRVDLREGARGLLRARRKDGGPRRMRRGAEPVLPPCEGVRHGGRDGPRHGEVHRVRGEGCDDHPRMVQADAEHAHTDGHRDGGAGGRRGCSRGDKHAQGDGHPAGVRQARAEQQVRRTVRAGDKAGRREGCLRPVLRPRHPPRGRRRDNLLEGCRRIHHGRSVRLSGGVRRGDRGSGGLRRDRPRARGLHGRVRIRGHRVDEGCRP